MSALEVKRTVLNSFTPLQVSSIYLSVDTAQKFSKDMTQDKDGNAIADCVVGMKQTDVSITRV